MDPQTCLESYPEGRAYNAWVRRGGFKARHPEGRMSVSRIVPPCLQTRLQCLADYEQWVRDGENAGHMEGER